MRVVTAILLALCLLPASACASEPRLERVSLPPGFAIELLALGPHVAALGMKFYQGIQFPAEYRGDIFIAEHGSWNRSTPIGYRVMRVSLKGADVPTYQVFARGWLEDGSAWGRPVDLLQMPDGALLVSDDKAGAIYRITYRP